MLSEKLAQRFASKMEAIMHQKSQQQLSQGYHINKDLYKSANDNDSDYSQAQLDYGNTYLTNNNQNSDSDQQIEHYSSENYKTDQKPIFSLDTVKKYLKQSVNLNRGKQNQQIFYEQQQDQQDCIQQRKDDNLVKPTKRHYKKKGIINQLLKTANIQDDLPQKRYRNDIYKGPIRKQKIEFRTDSNEKSKDKYTPVKISLKIQKAKVPNNCQFYDFPATKQHNQIEVSKYLRQNQNESQGNKFRQDSGLHYENVCQKQSYQQEKQHKKMNGDRQRTKKKLRNNIKTLKKVPEKPNITEMPDELIPKVQNKMESNQKNALNQTYSNQGLSKIQKSQVITIIQHFIFQNMATLAKNIAFFIQQKHKNNQTPSQKAQIYERAPRKMVNVSSQQESDNVKLLTKNLPKNLQHNPDSLQIVSQKNAIKKIQKFKVPKKVQIKRQISQKPKRNKQLSSQNKIILNQLEEKLQKIQKDNKDKANDLQFKRYLVSEALRTLRTLKVSKETEQMLIKQWIIRKKKRQQKEKQMKKHEN